MEFAVKVEKQKSPLIHLWERVHFINPVQKLNQAEISNDKIIPGLILNVEMAVEDHKPMKLYLHFWRFVFIFIRK